MSKRTLVIVSAAFVAYLAGSSPADIPAPPKGVAPPPKPADAAPGRYAVTAVASGAVMADTTTGATWVLRASADGATSVWIPAKRIDDPADAEKWLERERAVAASVAEEKYRAGEAVRRLEAELAERRALAQARQRQEEATKRP